MSKPYRRFEILLPLLFNDGKPVPDGLIADTLAELEQRFGSVSSETQTIHGRWHHEGRAYRDDTEGCPVNQGRVAFSAASTRRWNSAGFSNSTRPSCSSRR
jgi:hypothetical protein